MDLAYLSEVAITQFIESALREDIGNGDHSSLASVDPGHKSRAHLLIKSPGILAGITLAQRIFKTVDKSLTLDLMKTDGDSVSEGDIGFVVKGKAQSILSAERLVLNCMQRMSGIATYTNYLNSLISDTPVKLLDTRKTTPNFRLAEKWAVAIGGGYTHSFWLYDMIMLKDNHIDFAGGIESAIKATHQYLEEHNLTLKIEVETRNLQEVQQVIDCGGIHRIMLDNMSIEELQEAVQLISGRYETEASGGITEDTISEVAATGINYISVGALTHSVKSLDISLKAVQEA
jgi:nicotinate-nucleotide pyrophosphorylase (carboxylating)